jgi:hypothetical protein
LQEFEEGREKVFGIYLKPVEIKILWFQYINSALPLLLCASAVNKTFLNRRVAENARDSAENKKLFEKSIKL